MELSIASLSHAKAFTAKPVEKVIKWGEHTFTTYVRPLSYQTAVGTYSAMNGADPLATRIASSICDAEGKAIFTVADITGQPVYDKDGKLLSDPERGAIDPDLTSALLVAISEVQNVGKTAP